MGLRSSSSMSLKGLCIVGALELVCVLSLMHGVLAQDNNCSAATLTPLLPCLPYIEAGNTTTPASDCCSPLRSVLASSNPTCICQIAPLAQQSGVSINETRALEVASLCNQTVPPSITSCLSTGATSPLGAPSATPTSPSSSTTPPPQRGNESPNLGSALLPPSLLLIASIFVALFLHLGVIST